MSDDSPYGIDALAFGAHPDDVELFCGGVMARLAELGYRTGIVDLTRGELATHGTPEVRDAEARAAAEVLGAALRENLGLPDGGLDGSPASPQLPVVVAALRRLRPEIVLAPWIEERHPDHVEAGRLVARAAFFAGLARFETQDATGRFVPRRVLHYEMRYRMTPSFVMDTSTVQERKRAAIDCHASQLRRGSGPTATLIGSPLAIDAIEARDRYRGSQIGVRYGEALRGAGVVGLADPVAFFRAHPFDEPHAFEALP